ncbi:MAG TPA: UbiA-like polyprenyltransferase [Chitinophagales bacterium]|nr:UbiA-like polyprenyltransferase [Chitinophagales bacterium]
MKKYFSLVKFSHTVFALPFALIGFFLNFHLGTIPAEADALWIAQKFAFVLICMVTARNAAMGFNRYLDRQIDASNPRTIIREIPSGQISANNALFFVIANSLIFIATTYFINSLCFYLSPVALLVILGYSFTKRFTALCHIVLGIGLGLAPVGAFLTISGKFEWLPVIIGVAVACWTGGFDIIYALQDEEFDRDHKLHSIPAALGTVKALFVSRILHICTLLFLGTAAYVGDFSYLYMIGFVIFAGLIRYQQSLVTPTDLSKVDLAFFTTNGIASVTFSIFVIADIFLLH